ncbi:hypothetical protein BY458DRAFT_504009 [Sporodiniella umbellata]|nr:hypothetical protein BY458DRAFT_504009 [Sporodiniella umbellata]
MYSFQSSFWSPTASLDRYPDFRYGFDTLHKRLSESLEENKRIGEYIEQRIESERMYSNALKRWGERRTGRTSKEEEEDGLGRCFRVVCAESETSSREHATRAENLHTTALDPLRRFASRYSQRVRQSREHIQHQLDAFGSLVHKLASAKKTYDSRCSALMTSQPNYRLNMIKLGTRVFHDRAWIEDWIRPMPQHRQPIERWLQSEQQPPGVLHDLIGLNFVRQTAHDTFEKVVNTKPYTGFFKQVDLEQDMLMADKTYQQLVSAADLQRTRLEQTLLAHYEAMEKLELERVETLKQVFISLAASLSNTIPRYKETVDTMMLYQETLVPAKDVQMIVEQHRTGQFCPRPILYENYFYGTGHHQLFGVSLSEILRTEGGQVPVFVALALAKIEKDHTIDLWSQPLCLERVHHARKEINQRYPKVDLTAYDRSLTVSLLKLYLMELPDCPLTFELYETCKTVYACSEVKSPTEKDRQLVLLSQWLASLSQSHYQLCRALFDHFYRLHTPASVSLSHLLLRPQLESKMSTFERHPFRLVQDLIHYFPKVFSPEVDLANREDARRSRHLTGHLIPSSSTLFEDPDDSDTAVTPCLSKELSEELTSLDSFFLDD